MNETSVSLLERLRRRPDDASWKRLVDLYTPLIRTWLRRDLLPHADADDLVQEVLAVVEVYRTAKLRYQRAVVAGGRDDTSCSPQPTCRLPGLARWRWVVTLPTRL